MQPFASPQCRPGRIEISRPRPVFVNQSVFAHEELEYEFSESDFPSHFQEKTEMTHHCANDLASSIVISKQKRNLSSLYTEDAKPIHLGSENEVVGKNSDSVCEAVFSDCNLSKQAEGAFNGINLPGSRQRLRLSKASGLRQAPKLAFSVAKLPDDLIIKSILSGFLDTFEVLTSIALINKRFRRLSAKTVRILDLSNTNVQHSQLNNLLSLYQHVSTLNLSFCRDFVCNESSMSLILLKLPLLKVLITNSSCIVSSFIDYENIRKAKASSNVSCITMNPKWKKHQNPLEYLSISCTQGNIQEVLESIGRLFPRLRVLKASNLKEAIAEESNEGDLQNFEGAVPNETGADHVTLATPVDQMEGTSLATESRRVEKIQSSFRQLECLVEVDLSCNKDISDSIISSMLISRGTNLRSLNISGCPLLTDQSIKAITSSAKRLCFLGINFLKNLTTNSLKGISTLKRLDSLELSHITSDLDPMFQRLVGLLYLKNIDISGCPNITSDGITSMSQITSLEHINCSGMALNSGKDLLPLAGLPNLKSLDLQYHNQDAIQDTAVLEKFRKNIHISF